MKKTLKWLIILATPLLLLVQCRFNTIIQPASATPGEIITVRLKVSIEIVPEANPHKGILCMLLPADWDVVGAAYSAPVGSGTMDISHAWTDSVEACYPADQFSGNMHWVAMISDSGYTYEDPFEVQIDAELKTGLSEGCYSLGYLVTKATSGLICSGTPSWAPLSYPHPISISSTGQVCDTIKVGQATNWDDLFYRSSGWTGADGIYTIPLSGNETPDGPTDEKTLILFSDTFIGEVDQNDARENATLINNTYAVLNDRIPVAENIEFFWDTDSVHKPQAVFIPDTPQSNPGEWYWLMDGIAIADSIHVFGLRLRSTGGGAFGFEIVGVALLSFKLDVNDSIAEYRQVDTPVYYRNEDEGWEIVFGQAIMPMHDLSGNPGMDGYIYIYGPRNFSGRKELVAARVLPENLSDFRQWGYWDGAEWQQNIENCAAITNGISQEFSLNPLEDGRFILVFQTGNSVAIRIGESPVGPFGVILSIYDCPEVLDDPDIFVYNAKAHPHLSEDEQLLISYNVNTIDFWDHFTHAGIYRPRFINLYLPGDPADIASDRDIRPRSLFLAQNYPNPFNPTTVISWQLAVASIMDMSIYNLLGQKITTLASGWRQAGYYQVEWDASGLASGVYIYRLSTDRGATQTKKLVLMK